MKATKNATQNNMKYGTSVVKVARSVSFNSEQLSQQGNVSKDRERYITSVSARALAAIKG